MSFNPRIPRVNPRTFSDWAEFHRKMEALPEESRETFDLIYYQGLSQPKPLTFWVILADAEIPLAKSPALASRGPAR